MVTFAASFKLVKRSRCPRQFSCYIVELLLGVSTCDYSVATVKS